jgi:DNA modification methylase
MSNYQIINGDCIKILSELTRDKIKATMIFCDPPYNIGVNYGATTNDKRTRPEFISWCSDWIGECYINLQDNGSLWLLINHENAADLELVLRKTGFTVINWITWYESFGVNCINKFSRSSRRLFHAVIDPNDYIFNKDYVTRASARQEIYKDKRANPDGRLWDDVWGINPMISRVCGTHGERISGFPTQLPLSLLAPIISCASNPGDLVIDPFSGSATTGETCIRFKREYIGIEVNQDYVNRSWARLCRVKHEVYTEEYL